MQSEHYQSLSSKFQTTVVTHASEGPQQPSAEAQAAATNFCDHVAAVATDIGHQQTSQMLLLIMYHQLFDIGPLSTALSHELNRCAIPSFLVCLCLVCFITGIEFASLCYFTILQFVMRSTILSTALCYMTSCFLSCDQHNLQLLYFYLC